MKKIYLYLIVFICVFSLCLLFIQYEMNESYESSFDLPTIKSHQKETMKNIFGVSLDCKSMPISTSQGLVVDSAIVCNATKDIPKDKLPEFYYEHYPENSDPNGFLFVNLDYTDFKKILYNPKSPKNILCKTKHTYELLKSMLSHKNVIYTGFTSADRYLPNVSKNMRSFIHIPGKSPNKGTVQVIEAWKRNPNWPVLTVICRDELYDELSKTIDMRQISKNINMITSFVLDSKLIELMNMNGIHVCTSKTEGFGHYLNEARSTGAVVLYTDAPPMNEMFVDNETGISVKAQRSFPINDGVCPTFSVTIDSIKESVERVLRKSESDLREMGKRSRDAYLRDDRMFKERLAKLV
jgi:glycosyltransferase involved in cell wall biosynthesis